MFTTLRVENDRKPEINLLGAAAGCWAGSPLASGRRSPSRNSFGLAPGLCLLSCASKMAENLPETLLSHLTTFRMGRKTKNLTVKGIYLYRAVALLFEYPELSMALCQRAPH